MDHSDIRHKLSEYIDGAVTREDRAAIDGHLKACTTCSDALAELRKTIEQVKRIEEVEAPAWMTKKIMANVRAEAEEKKGLFHRLFYPLAVKLPIQAVGVLFLTVTAYYIYSGTHPADKYAEAPVGRLAKQGAPAEVRDAVKRQEPEIAAEQKKKIAQEPGYKSLDMKYEYEKPEPPVPASPGAGTMAARDESTASAPQKSAEPAAKTREELQLESRAVAPRSAAPSVLSEQPAPGAGEKARKAKTPATADKDADDTLDVTEHFVRTDLPENRKVRGLQFSTRKISGDAPGLSWLRDMPAYRSKPCGNRFLVDVESGGSSFKYLYCYEHAGIKLLGIFELANGVWSENNYSKRSK